MIKGSHIQHAIVWRICSLNCLAEIEKSKGGEIFKFSRNDYADGIEKSKGGVYIPDFMS